MYRLDTSITATTALLKMEVFSKSEIRCEQSLMYEGMVDTSGLVVGVCGWGRKGRGT